MDIRNRSLLPPLSRLSLAIACITLAQSTLAQEVAEQPMVIIVEGELQPLDNALTPEPSVMRQLSAATSDSASLLRDVPGVSLNGAGGVSSLPVIHGLADDRLRIKVDGMDLIAACPNHMNPPLSYVEPSNLEQIRVYAGISPVSVGGDSIGGTIIAERRVMVISGVREGRKDGVSC